MPLTRASRARWMQALLHTHDTPRRTAAALALGVAIGFSPFLGLHVVIGTALAFLFNLNRVAVLIGVVSNVPWIIGPYYAAATALGAWLIRTPLPPNLLAQLRGLTDVPEWEARASAVAHLVRPLLLPFMIGSSISALVLAVLVYAIAKPVLESRAFAAHKPGRTHNPDIDDK